MQLQSLAYAASLARLAQIFVCPHNEEQTRKKVVVVKRDNLFV